MIDDAALENYKYDPTKSQVAIVEAIENETKGDLSLVDPTNPFMMLLEANTVSGVTALTEMRNNDKTIYPSLSRSVNDLYPHISEEEEKHLFASPSETYVRLLLNLKDVEENGVIIEETKNINKGLTIYNVVIPKNTEVIVNETTFTIMNDVDITLTKSSNGKRSAFVTYVSDETSIEFKDIGILSSTIISDKDDISWILFETPVKQLSVTRYEGIPVSNDIFEVTIPLTDAYYFSEVSIQNSNTLEWEPVKKVFSDKVFDSTIKSIKIEVLEDTVVFKIPQVYILNNSMLGIIRFLIYTTKGKILLPLNKHSQEDFSIKIAKETFTSASAASRNINILAMSTRIVDGGVNRREIRDLRKKIINKTAGQIDLPITENQLSETARIEGFTIHKAIDTITDRLYIASKNINDTTLNNNIPVNVDIFNNTSVFELAVNVNNNVVIEDKDILIKSNTIFKYENGSTFPISDAEENLINNMLYVDKIKYLTKHKLYFTPYYYVISSDVDVISSRAYDLDRNSLDKLAIKSKNTYLSQNVNIVGYNLIKKGNGYDIYFQLKGNESYEAIENSIGIQLAIPVEGSDNFTYLHSVPYAVEVDDNLFPELSGSTLFKISIEADFRITVEDRMRITNSFSPIDVHGVDLKTKANIIIYTTDMTVDDHLVNNNNSNAYLGINYEELYFEGNALEAIGLTKEELEITFGNKLEYLWAKVEASYTDRRYVKYENDIYLRYLEDVYQVDPLTGCSFILSDENGDGSCDSIERVVLHTAGEIVKDIDGKKIIEHRMGDVKLINGEPIVDVVGGLIRYVDILMFEYEYLAVKRLEYSNYIKDTLNILNEWLVYKLVSLNSITLEHTSIFYRPRKSVLPIHLTDGYVENFSIKPKIEIYFNAALFDIDIEIDELKSTVGKIVHKYFEKKYIVITDLKEELIDNIGGNPIGVKVVDHVTDDKEIISLSDTSNRFSLSKKINSKYDVVYDLEIKIIKV